MADYYDVEAILAEDERVPVTFTTGATGVGRALDPSCDDNDLKRGTKVDLPFWMTPMLAARNMITVGIPACFDNRVRKEVQADAGCVDMRQRCSYFYDLGSRLTNMVRDPTLGQFILLAFGARYKELLCKAHNASDEEVTRCMKTLSQEELDVFQAGRDSMLEFNRWRARTHAKLEMAPILGRKRKRTALSSF
ncbi:hypothetical protein CBR_g38120 [Chara braunii]|uniref:Uncharacterized protein n=1 Tax=Chara braunii TaxID=69332 RepID=A0A388LP66_CHABU|nr:hypothetical protein CBR_g38120 [Chara braunii]|eukprot:GBG84146.1 hypothetical protein CBR_g38120 [Chara braunii]